MARPSTIKAPDGGIILLKNCTPETISKVRASLNPSASTEATLVVAQPVGAPVLDEVAGPMNENAIGVFQDKTTLSYYTAQVSYNPTTKQAKVKSVTNQGSTAVATEAFKLLAVKNNFV